MKRFISLQRRFSSYNQKNFTTYSVTWWFPYGKCHLLSGNILSGIKDDLDDKKIVDPYIVNSILEGSYY